jgi:FkbM family methyltransferase
MKLFCTITDDDRLLPHFIRHYREVGVREFFFAVAPSVMRSIAQIRDRHTMDGDQCTITAYDALDVANSIGGGNSAVSEMRRWHQSADEWAMIVDLDEFVEFKTSPEFITAVAEAEGANVVRGVMFDRLPRDGNLMPFYPDTDLERAYPVKARFNSVVLGAFDMKGVLVKGHLAGLNAHHTFHHEKVASERLEISHYRWNESTIDRLRNAVASGAPRPDQYNRAIAHYERFGRMRWDLFGGRDDGRAPTDADLFDERSYLIEHPDVHNAVIQGLFKSGWDHYERHGRAEGRALRYHDINGLTIPETTVPETTNPTSAPTQSEGEAPFEAGVPPALVSRRIGVLERGEIEHLAWADFGGVSFPARRLSVEVSEYEVSLRLGTTDPHTFIQVFVQRDYETPYLPETANVIVDLGANVGLSAVFFAQRYPAARLFCVEPEPTNHAALRGNTAALGDRVVCEHAAVWLADGTVEIAVDDGHWGAKVSDHGSSVPAYRFKSLWHRWGRPHIDMLKVDIEGTEVELFADTAEWLDHVDFVMAETHDRFRPDSEGAVRRALRDSFEEMPASGENLVFRRRR